MYSRVAHIVQHTLLFFFAVWPIHKNPIFMSLAFAPLWWVFKRDRVLDTWRPPTRPPTPLKGEDVTLLDHFEWTGEVWSTQMAFSLRSGLTGSKLLVTSCLSNALVFMHGHSWEGGTTNPNSETACTFFWVGKFNRVGRVNRKQVRRFTQVQQAFRHSHGLPGVFARVRLCPLVRPCYFRSSGSNQLKKAMDSLLCFKLLQLVIHAIGPLTCWLYTQGYPAWPDWWV